MAKIIFISLCLFFLSASTAFSADVNAVTLVFPIRDRQLWRSGQEISHLTKLVSITSAHRLPATWLIQYDALYDEEIVTNLRELPSFNEVGLFLEVSRYQAESNIVPYDFLSPWTASKNIFLSGYDLASRQILIDSAFEKFKSVFGYYPKSFGAWYIDVFSLEYIRDKYKADVALGLADQYSTDGYQSWGQYINAPYYVSKKSAIEPSNSPEDNTGVLKVLWAPREPTLSYGGSVEQSNFSLQINDYYRGKGLNTAYFDRLLRALTLDVQAPLSQVTIGLEVSEIEQAFYPELDRVIALIAKYHKEGKITPLTLSYFSNLFRETYQQDNPTFFIKSAQQGTSSYWYMSPNYRLGLFLEKDRLFIRDLRAYHQNGYRDNDQLFPDRHANLVRLVPASIDQVVYGNQIDLGFIDNLTVKQQDQTVTITFSQDKRITLFPDRAEGEIEFYPQPKNRQPIRKNYCHNEFGQYQPPFSCLKKLIVYFSNYLPDIRYSKIDGNLILGLRSGPEHIFAVRLPKFKVGKFYFQFNVLDSFISLRKFLTPDFKWFGKQEFEVASYPPEKIVPKDSEYGQEHLLQKEKPVLENGYYRVYP
ncbi:hypothetical protein HY333_01050 [Candidatus Collierbacteria bacterium]|nr:hypothetical protein [Candidatus Collierbacteria bacterium]